MVNAVIGGLSGAPSRFRESVRAAVSRARVRFQLAPVRSRLSPGASPPDSFVHRHSLAASPARSLRSLAVSWFASPLLLSLSEALTNPLP